MRRKQKKLILQDLKKKMVFLVGPRQVGKTYLAKEIAKEYKHPLYLNYDVLIDKKTILAAKWLPETDLVIFDELHKMPKWKNYLKGVFDVHPEGMHILVTGSARLETFRQSGDSLAGRFFVHHLLPLSLKELVSTPYAGDVSRLLVRGGFPEPFLAESDDAARKWRDVYVDSLVRDDVLDFADIDNMRALRDVFEIIRTKVGSNLSYANIAADVGVAATTVKRYVAIFEALYIVYRIVPYTKKIQRSLLKEPKLYFYDTGLVKGDSGAVFENMIANALQKHVHGIRDARGLAGAVMYLKNKEGKEVDFALVNDAGELEKLVEVKVSDESVAKQLLYFAEKYNVPAVQVVQNMRYSRKVSELVEVRKVEEFLEGLFM
jgi:uncharacterized protein